MKTLKYNLLFVICLLCLAARSQQRTVTFEIAQKTSMPLGNFKTITDKISANGWEAAVMYGLSDNVSLGLQAGFQDFYQKYGRQVYHGAGGDLSAVISNSVQVMPLLLKGKYVFHKTSAVRPFAALGVGGSLVQYGKYYGQFSDARSGFVFTAQPELGIAIPVGRYKRAGINIAAAYNYTPFRQAGADGMNTVGIKAGVSLPLR